MPPAGRTVEVRHRTDGGPAAPVYEKEEFSPEKGLQRKTPNGLFRAMGTGTILSLGLVDQAEGRVVSSLLVLFLDP